MQVHERKVRVEPSTTWKALILDLYARGRMRMLRDRDGNIWTQLEPGMPILKIAPDDERWASLDELLRLEE